MNDDYVLREMENMKGKKECDDRVSSFINVCLGNVFRVGRLRLSCL